MTAPPTEAEAYELLERLRWDGAPSRCPHCGTEGPFYYLRPRGGPTRRTRTGSPTERRVWKCGHCRRQFSVLNGTVFESTRLPIRTLIDIMDEWSPGPAPSARELSHRHRISVEGARGLLRRLGDAVPRAVESQPPPSGDHPLLAALLEIPPAEAEEIRARTAGRRRPHAQRGPTAMYGGR
jgi:transposase-like protein